jgi:hypothetical protein
MPNLVTVALYVRDRNRKPLANFKVRTYPKNRPHATMIRTTTAAGTISFPASPNSDIGIDIITPDSNYEHNCFINSKDGNTQPIIIGVGYKEEEYSSNTSNLIIFYAQVTDSNGKPMPNFPLKTAYKNSNLQSDVKYTDKTGLVELYSSPNRIVDIKPLMPSDTFEVHSSYKITAHITYSIKLKHPLEKYCSKITLRIFDKEGNKKYPNAKFRLTSKYYRFKETIYQDIDKDSIFNISSFIGDELGINIFRPNGTLLKEFNLVITRMKHDKTVKVPVHIKKTETRESEPEVDEKIEPKSSCGLKYRGKVKVTRWKTHYGPVYWGKTPLSGYGKWDELIENGALTRDEKMILKVVSPNEGKLDSVQSYDSEIITAGAMQKTINSRNGGELATQMSDFKIKNPDLFKSLFSNCGWEVTGNGSNARVSYQGMQGKKLKSLIRKGSNKTNFKKTVSSSPIESMIEAVIHPKYVRLQIEDLIKRLRRAISPKPLKPSSGKYPYPIKTYIQGYLGRATVLDHSINRPAYVAKDFGKSLGVFFRDHPSISKNPEDWGSSRGNYEKIIIEHYGKNRRMTDAKNRYRKMKDAFNDI